MKVLRAHYYDPIMRLRAEAERVPAHWLEAVEPWSLIVLPDDLKPSWIGLSLRPDSELIAAKDTAVGDRTFDTMGGWTASLPGQDGHGYWVRDVPHIFLSHDSVEHGAVHEIGHALSHAWHVDEASFFRPEKAWHEYMRTNPSEFFACALSAFLWPEERDDVHWNRADVAERVPDLHAFLMARLEP